MDQAICRPLHPLVCFLYADWKEITWQFWAELQWWKMVKTGMLEMMLKMGTALMQRKHGLRILVPVNQVRSTWSDLQRQLICIKRRSIGASDVEVPLNFKGESQEGSLSPSEKTGHTVGIPDQNVLFTKPQQQTPFLNPNPFSIWCGIKNIAPVRISEESSMALLHNGCQVNTVTPEFIEACSLNVGLRSNMIGGRMSMVGLGGMHTCLLSYIIIRVQVYGVEGYNEDQIDFAIPDLSKFVSRVQSSWILWRSEESSM